MKRLWNNLLSIAGFVTIVYWTAIFVLELRTTAEERQALSLYEVVSQMQGKNVVIYLGSNDEQPKANQ